MLAVAPCAGRYNSFAVLVSSGGSQRECNVQKGTAASNATCGCNARGHSVSVWAEPVFSGHSDGTGVSGLEEFGEHGAQQWRQLLQAAVRR